ncbi:hypothetical protein M422DRAFT_221842 [Sphaerobolus stellatus SS14]|nr:hypothetical protein M422DRAFT_221842 [Sphaerobolus stellatus SS14]
MAERRRSTPVQHSVARLGEYQIIRDIAEGTFGKVKMAKHVITGQIVAMKFLSKDVVNSSGTKTRVLREVQYMRILKHPHIVKLYEVISTPTHIIIVLEYVGGELFNYIVKNGQMRESVARRFFQQLISGIDYSHRRKVIHRDLKPENVLLDDKLNVKIADFGLSNVVQDGEFLMTSCGSPNYAAPEVIRGLRYTGPEIDVWSCGVILYVMLCGRLPFEDDDVNTLFAKIALGEYVVPSELSKDARYLLSKMLTVDPVKRITIPEIMESSFYLTDLPKYLSPAPTGFPVIGSLSALVRSRLPLGYECIKGIGRLEEDLVQELADSMEGVSYDDILEALRIDEGYKGNAVKVAYMLLRDKRYNGKGLIIYETEECEAQLAAAAALQDAAEPTLRPRFPITPGDADDKDAFPFEDVFEEDEDDEDDEDETTETEEDQDNIPTPTASQQPNFAILKSSLPSTPSSEAGPYSLTNGDTHPAAAHNTHHTHHSSHRSGGHRSKHKGDREHKRMQWHFGIRSRSPRMEVMLEIYRTLRSLGMEWKEKRELGGLAGLRTQTERERERERFKIERRRDMDGRTPPEFDARTAASIYFVETRARKDDVVVLMDLQLYQVDEENYLVDFKHQGYYRASTDPGATKFDRAPSPSHSGSSSSVSSLANLVAGRPDLVDDLDTTVSPFLFMDTACRLILNLAGEGDSPGQ